MNTQRLQLVSFEQAKKLKELGFDWNTSQYYSSLGLSKSSMMSHSEFDYFIAWAPSIPLALKWFRDVKDIYCTVGYSAVTKDILYTANLVYKEFWWNSGDNRFNTYEEAESALLDELLEICMEGKSGL